MSQSLIEARQRAEKELLELADAAESRKLTDEEAERVASLKSDIVDLRSREALQAEVSELRTAMKQDEATSEDVTIRTVARAASAQVEVRAKSPYEADNHKASWFKDLNTLRDRYVSNAEVDEARSRLQSHYEATGDEGSFREVRTYSESTDAEGGYLVAPTYLQSEFVELLAAGRPTADLVGKYPLPPKTSTVNIPTQDGATAVAVHTQNNALTETSATFSTVAADVARVGGAATIPNFLLDRSMPGADQVVLRDLAKQYAVKVDDIVLNSTTSNRKGILQETGLGGATATAGTATIAELWPAILNAVNDVAVGTYAYPTAIIMHPRRWAWFAGQLDNSDRPIIGSVNPQNALAGFNGSNVPGAFQGPMPSGSILGIPVYLDATIPTTLGSGTDEDRIIVCRPEEAWLMETAPMFAVSRDAEFLKDQTIARVTGDVAFTCARRKAAFSIISGTALNDTI
jgi:HK97 family phage major capsid protein